MNPYFTVNDSEHFTFYRIPKLLFTDEIYQTVSTDAKMLYGLLLDRLSLSEKNDWKDEHGSLNILGNVAAGDFRNCVPPVPLRHFYAISAWGCVGK